jgi:hypothetical protein
MALINLPLGDGAAALPREALVDSGDGAAALPRETLVDTGHGAAALPREALVDSGDGAAALPRETLVDLVPVEDQFHSGELHVVVWWVEKSVT